MWVTILLGAVFLTTVEARRNNRAVVLPATEAQSVPRLCSRDSVPAVEAGWLPAPTDVAVIQKKFPEIQKLQRTSRDSGVPIEAPQSYYRQYVGVIVGGRKFIYINAICGKPSASWRNKLEDTCDGGCNWGVLFDVQTGTFSGFGMNGIG